MEKDMKSIETEEIKSESALSLEELDSLVQDQDLSPGTRDMLWKQRESVIEEMKQKAQKSADPISGIKAILEIPEHEGLGEKIVNLGKISVKVLFWRATESLDAEQVKLVGQVLRRVDPNGNGLRDEPYWKMFLENAKMSFPDDVEKMVEAVGKAGISKEDYIDAVLRHTMLSILHTTDAEVLADAVVSHKNLLSDISDFYGISNLDMEEKQRLFLAADILLSEYFGANAKDFDDKAIPNNYIAKAIEVYRWLRNNNMIEIGEDRQKITEIYHKYELNGISQKKRDKEIRKLFTII